MKNIYVPENVIDSMITALESQNVALKEHIETLSMMQETYMCMVNGNDAYLVGLKKLKGE